MRFKMRALIRLIRILDSEDVTRGEKLAALKRCRLDGTLSSDDVAELVDLYRLAG